MTQAQRDISKKLRILNHAKAIGNVSKTCRYFGIGRQAFYEWKKAYEQHGEGGLINKKPCPANPALRTPPEIEEKVFHLRRKYHLGQQRMAWFLERYHGIKISRLRLACPEAQWHEQASPKCEKENCSDEAIRKTGSWSSYSGRCQISQI